MKKLKSKKRIAIFGSTGSVGKQTLSVVDNFPDLFSVEILTTHTNTDLLFQQVMKYKPKMVVIGEDVNYRAVQKQLSSYDTKILVGKSGLSEAASYDEYDMMVAAIVGYAGLHPTLKAVEKGKTIALANKETMVVAGDIIMKTALKTKAQIIPVDSEHSAIFQCLEGEKENKIEKIILTCSGGAFFGKKPNYLTHVKKEHTLQHPVWNMGAKISVDSATLMNKGLEMIEAKWLFALEPSQIEVVIHPQSIIHSMVQFEDGSIKAQMGTPNMTLPIQYALTYPQRLKSDFPRLNFREANMLKFDQPDIRTFKNLALAMEALNKGGNLPCVMNAANEIVVYAFLKNQISFLDMSDVIEKTMAHVPFVAHPTLEHYEESDAAARLFAANKIKL